MRGDFVSKKDKWDISFKVIKFPLLMIIVFYGIITYVVVG